MRKNPRARCREQEEGHLLSRDTAAAKTGLHAPRRAQEVANPGAQSCEATSRNPGARHPEPTRQDQAGTHLATITTSLDWQLPTQEVQTPSGTHCEETEASQTAHGSMPAARSHIANHCAKVMGSPSQQSPTQVVGNPSALPLVTAEIGPVPSSLMPVLRCQALHARAEAMVVRAHRQPALEVTNPSSSRPLQTTPSQCEQNNAEVKMSCRLQDLMLARKAPCAMAPATAEGTLAEHNQVQAKLCPCMLHFVETAMNPMMRPAAPTKQARSRQHLSKARRGPGERDPAPAEHFRSKKVRAAV